MKKLKQLVRFISEERILQLSNDLAEGIVTGTVAEWRAVARYWQNSTESERRNMMKIKVALKWGEWSKSAKAIAEKEITEWLKSNP